MRLWIMRSSKGSSTSPSFPQWVTDRQVRSPPRMCLQASHTHTHKKRKRRKDRGHKAPNERTNDICSSKNSAQRNVCLYCIMYSGAFSQLALFILFAFYPSLLHLLLNTVTHDHLTDLNKIKYLSFLFLF